MPYEWRSGSVLPRYGNELLDKPEFDYLMGIEKSPRFGGFGGYTQIDQRSVRATKRQTTDRPQECPRFRSQLVFRLRTPDLWPSRITPMAHRGAFHCPSTAAWYRWDMPIPKHCDLSYILPHFQEKCNGFSWFYRNSAMTDGKSSINFLISSSVVSWQRDMRMEPSMRSGATPIASST